MNKYIYLTLDEYMKVVIFCKKNKFKEIKSNNSEYVHEYQLNLDPSIENNIIKKIDQLGSEVFGLFYVKNQDSPRIRNVVIRPIRSVFKLMRDNELYIYKFHKITISRIYSIFDDCANIYKLLSNETFNAHVSYLYGYSIIHCYPSTFNIGVLIDIRHIFIREFGEILEIEPDLRIFVNKWEDKDIKMRNWVSIWYYPKSHMGLEENVFIDKIEYRLDGYKLKKDDPTLITFMREKTKILAENKIISEIINGKLDAKGVIKIIDTSAEEKKSLF